MIRAVSNALLSVVYPQECRICSNIVEDAADVPACRECWTKTRIFNGSELLCSKCGAFSNAPTNSANVNCRECGEHFYDLAAAAGIYEHAIAAAILYLKQTPHIALRTKVLLVQAFEKFPSSDFDLIVPVPLSRKRFAERGFNQAEILAAVLARHTGLRVDKKSLQRVVHTPMHRVAMDKKARELTVKNAFKVFRPKLIAGRSILLIDDILTSGATASNCARVLKKSGADRVAVLTLARAV